MYTHALTQADLEFLPESKVLCTLEASGVAAVASRSCAGVVDPPWLCNEKERRREEWKEAESGHRQVKVLEV